MATLPGARVALYTRVSVDRRDTGRSVGEQEADLRATAAREGWRVAETFTDNDRSASKFAKKPRPAYLRLVQFVEAGLCDVVAVWELSRLSRQLGVLVAFRDVCADRGVTWSIGGRTFDPGNHDDTWPLIAQAIQAENESAQTSKRVRRAMTATAQAGRPHGRLTYGYRREYDPTTKAFLAQVIDAEQAAVLREIADRCLVGEAFFSIARDLTARGVPAPAGGTVWHPTNCTRLLKNPAYVARRMQNGQYVADAVWPPIFTEREWLLLQAKLTDPARLTRKETAIRHLLTGFAICGVCDSRRMATIKQRAGHRNYTCSECFGVARRQDVVDEHVTAKVIERLTSRDVADMFGRGEDDDRAASLAAEHAKELRVRLEGFEDEATAGKISAPAFGRIEAKLTAEIEAAEMAAQRATMPEAVRHLAGVDPARVAAVWADLTIIEKRDALRAMGAVVTIHPTGKGRRAFDPESVSVTFPKR